MTSVVIARRRPNSVRRVLKRPQFWFGSISLVAAFAWYIVFVFDPIVRGVVISFLNYKLFKPSASRFVGLANYVSLFEFDRFIKAFVNTGLYTVMLYAVLMPLCLLLSWALATVRHGRRTYQFFVFLPVVVSLVAISLLFRMIMSPGTGMLTRILESMHLPGSAWIFGSDSALFSVLLVEVWKSVGFYVILLTAAMLAVSAELEDAARVDGAGTWRVFRHVTLPSIAPTLAFVSILIVLAGLQAYVVPTVLGPGPGDSTLMATEFIVTDAFQSFDIGGAAAAASLLGIFLIVITLLQLRLGRSRI